MAVRKLLLDAQEKRVICIQNALKNRIFVIKEKKQTCYQILYLNSKDANGNIFLLTCLVFKFAIPSISTKSKYDGYIRENMLKGVLDIINIKNLVVVKI